MMLSKILPCSALLDLKTFHYNLWHWKIFGTKLSVKRSSNRFSITSFVITTQIICFWFENNFQEYKLCVYIKNLETALLLSMLLKVFRYWRPYSMAKSKPLQHLWKSCKHPQTLKFKTSCHHFSSEVSCITYKLLKINIFLVSRCTRLKRNIVKIWHFSSFKCKN